MNLPSAPEGKAAVRGVGIGLRVRHYREFLDSHPQADWLEVHSENYFGDGGYDLHVLEHVRARYPISLHGVALSLGSADGVREGHLAKLKRLVDRIEPALVSEHLCWAALGQRHFNDLLPLPYTRATLNQVASQVSQVQEFLHRPILIENVSSYLQFRASEMSEFVFLAELAERSGCGILLDVNNVFVNSVNHGFDPERALLEIPIAAVGEIHLAGHCAAGELLIDDHGSRVAPQVWSLYETACRRFGPVPALIEWDTSIPPLDILLDEATIAARLSQVAHA
ncbi:MAG: DUF692 domain-containing protein [Prolixibacteraceae bacterium]|nr:DUF692 domain-containing protein [Burkholderiales bacterium]